MAKVIGRDTYLAEKRISYAADGIFLTYVVFIALLTFWVYIAVFHFPLVGATIVMGLVYIIFFILKKPTEEKLRLARSYRKGLIGEENVRKILQTLPDLYTVFENVVIPPLKSNIDFVIIGPTGIFSVEVKSHKGHITNDGQQLLLNGAPFKEGDILHQSWGESVRLSDYLLSKNISTPEIQPLLVFSNKYATMRFGKKPVLSVLVIGASWLSDTIQNITSKAKLTSDQINDIYNCLNVLLNESTESKNSA
jgi:hypothetical protein